MGDRFAKSGGVVQLAVQVQIAERIFVLDAGADAELKAPGHIPKPDLQGRGKPGARTLGRLLLAKSKTPCQDQQGSQKKR
jgi:hypothetical protein